MPMDTIEGNLLGHHQGNGEDYHMREGGFLIFSA